MAIKWVDRVPTNPNRMKITPENGSSYFATVERADNPTVTGTPVNAQNLNAMQEAAGLSDNKTVYVSTVGSDSVGDGSEANPYATINKALSTIPKNLNGYAARVRVAAGTYSGSVSVKDFGNGSLYIYGNSGDAVTITGAFEVINVGVLEISNLSITLQNSMLSVVGSNVRVFSPFGASGSQYGVYANHGSYLMLLSTVTVNNAGASASSIAVTATNNSNVYVESLLGDNMVAFAATRGATCSYGTDGSTSSTAKFFTERGGRIYTGAQTDVPNY